MEELEEARRSNERVQPSRTVATGLELLKKRSFRIGAEQWTVREQVLLAALDLHELGVAESMLKELEGQFPASQRVARLRGLYLEACGKSKEAAEVYEATIKENATNTVARKRKVCLLKSAGKLSEAIKLLVEYLERFQADSEAWKELAALYVESGNLKNASFCLEEVILSNPHSYLSYLAYAESLYTLGGEIGNLLEARKYFCQSLVKKKAPANGRALWGLAVTTKAVQSYASQAKDSKSSKAALQSDEEDLNRQLSAKAAEELSKAPMAPGMEVLVAAALKRLAV